MRAGLTAAALWMIFAPHPGLGADVLMFDMGTGESELRSGFTRITAESVYREEAGYGWRSADGLREHYRHFDRQWQYNEQRGRTQPPEIYTNQITCDSIISDRPNAFLVDVAPGDYTVYLLFGLSTGSVRDYHDFEVSVGGSGSRVKIPGPWIFEKRVFRTTVTEGRLAIGLVPRTDWPLACAIIFPTGQEEQVRDEVLAPLEEEVTFLPPDVAAEWKETKHVDERPLPEFTATDRRRGYAVFGRHYSEVVYPNTIPRQAELDPELSAFASLGEYEPVTFTVFPLEDLSGATVRASDLRSGDGVISRENIDVRHVRYMLVRPNYSSFFSYHVAPDVLEHRDSVDVKKGRNARVWVTIKVPEDAEPGVYEGVLTFKPGGGGEATDVRLRLRVLPIRLEKNPEHVYGMYYRDPSSHVRPENTRQANGYFRFKADAERRDMVEHGMNTHISGVSGLTRDDEGKWTMDGAETERRIALDRKHGLADRPLVVSFSVSSWYARLVDSGGLGSHMRLVRSDVPDSFFDEVTEMVRAVEKEKQQYDWPEFLYYPIDEPATAEESVRFMVNVLAAIKRVPGVRTYVTADPTKDQFEPMWPYVDVWCCQPFVFGREKILRLSRERQIEFWCYPNHISGENDHTPIRGARMTWGFGFWKSGFKALIPWIYQASRGDPWNYLDGTSMDFFNRSTAEGEPIPVAMWEAYREGIDDGRYVYTLGQLIERARAQGGAAAALAEESDEELKFVWDAIGVQEKYKYDDLPAGADFDAYRWLLASEILRLAEALE